MTLKERFVLLIGSILLIVGACAKDIPCVPNLLPPEAPPLDDGCSSMYARFVEGYSLYVGTVVDCEPEPGRRFYELSTPMVEIKGELRFQVEQTLFGQNVPELQMHYSSSHAADVLGSDWGGPAWDEHPPRSGLRLAMLVYTTKDEHGQAKRLTDEGDATHLWDALKGNPFIQELAEACDFLGAPLPKNRQGLEKDRVCLVKDRIGLVKRFGGSKYPTIREFVHDVVFGPDDVNHHPTPELASATPELMLEYLRASSTIEVDYMRADAIGRIGAWLWIKDNFHKAPQEVRLAYGHWCLAMLDNPEGYRETIRALSNLRGMCQNYGIEETVGCFPDEGRAGLVKRVEACATSPKRDYEKEIQEEARKLLELLKEK
jgi:hypothetical protein